MIIHTKCFNSSFPLIITSSRTDARNISTIGFLKNVKCWITIYFTCRCL